MPEINCVFENFPWKIDGNTRYTCVINECLDEFFDFTSQHSYPYSYEKFKIASEKKYIHLKGEHKRRDKTFFLSLPTMSNSDVAGIFFSSCRLLKIPSNFIASNFSSLKALSIKSSMLREISRDDFKPLANLEVISLNNNNLTYLPADVFVDLKDLKSLSFANNKIKLIGLEIFDHLSQLSFVDLTNNEGFNVVMSLACNLQGGASNVKTVKDVKELRAIFEKKLFANSGNVQVTLEEFKEKLAASQQETQMLDKKCLELTESNDTLEQSHQIALMALEEAQMKLWELESARSEEKCMKSDAEGSQRPAGVGEPKLKPSDPSTSKAFSNSSLCLQLFNKLNANDIDSVLCKKFIETPSIFSDIAEVLRVDDFKDFTVNIGDENFRVHKLVLAARSPLFADLLRENFSAENLNLENIPDEIFREILKFMYGDKVEVNERNSKEIFMAAGRLKMFELQDIAVSLLIHLIDESNAVEMLKLSNKYEHDELREKSFEEIQKFFSDKPLKAELAYDCEKVEKLIEAKRKLDEMRRHFEEEMES